MKRLVPTAAILFATSTPAFTQNTEQENNAAVAAVIYMIAQERCKMTTGEDGKLRGMTMSVIEGNGLTWEQVVYGEKQMIGNFLKDNPVYEKATNNDPAAVKTVCNGARAMLAKKKQICARDDGLPRINVAACHKSDGPRSDRHRLSSMGGLLLGASLLRRAGEMDCQP